MLLNRIRRSTSGKQHGNSGAPGEEVAMPSLRKAVHLVSDPKNLDESVGEVFDLMLGVHCVHRSADKLAGSEAVTAVVGFGGVLSGACVFRCGAAEAIRIASHLAGSELTELDDTVKDGIGEICNMLAGAWKGKIPDLAAHTGLSIPAVITGRDYNLRIQAPEFQLHHDYEFDETRFAVTIVCDALR